MIYPVYSSSFFSPSKNISKRTTFEFARGLKTNTWNPNDPNLGWQDFCVLKGLSIDNRGQLGST